MMTVEEILYLANRIQKSVNGDAIGWTADGCVASTWLCFMIKSLVSKYKNTVAIMVYINFQARKFFECPPMDHIIPDGCAAKFSNIVQLNDLQATMALKKGHRLTPAVLAAKSVDETSVKLAVAAFCESTCIVTLWFILPSTKISLGLGWLGTAAFVSFFIKMWNVMNVKTWTKGKHKKICQWTQCDHLLTGSCISWTSVQHS